MRSKRILLTFAGLFLMLCACDRPNSAPSTPIEASELPVYKDAVKIKHHADDELERVSVSYQLITPFPAREVIEFYEAAFKEKGYEPFSEDGLSPMRWEVFNSKTGDYDPAHKSPARWIGSWVDDERSLRIILALVYREDGRDKEWDETLLVDCSRQKFFKFSGPLIRKLPRVTPDNEYSIEEAFKEFKEKVENDRDITFEESEELLDEFIEKMEKKLEEKQE